MISCLYDGDARTCSRVPQICAKQTRKKMERVFRNDDSSCIKRDEIKLCDKYLVVEQLLRGYSSRTGAINIKGFRRITMSRARDSSALCLHNRVT